MALTAAIPVSSLPVLTDPQGMDPGMEHCAKRRRRIWRQFFFKYFIKSFPNIRGERLETPM
jgi:hypothetical protein